MATYRRTAVRRTVRRARRQEVSRSGRALRIGIDARAATEVPAGRGRVVRELLRALAAREEGKDGAGAERLATREESRDGAAGERQAGAEHSYILYAREAWAEEELDERFQWRLIDAKDPWWHVRAARAANGECDVFLSSNSYLTSRFLRIASVAIVHDLTTFEPAMHAKRASRAIERLTLGMAVRRSAKLLAVSQATAEALIGRFPGAASRTVVAPLGVATGLGGTANGADGASLAGTANGADGASLDRGSQLDSSEAAALPAAGFVLAVGTLEPRKNLPRLVEAYAAMPRELQSPHPLVVVGGVGLGDERHAAGAAISGRALHDAGLRIGWGPGRAVSTLRGLLLPLAGGGFWPAGAGGDGGGRGGADLRCVLAAGGRR